MSDPFNLFEDAGSDGFASDPRHAYPRMGDGVTPHSRDSGESMAGSGGMDDLEIPDLDLDDAGNPHPQLDPLIERARFDKIIDAVLDGAVPHDALGQADAPGSAWRELATLRMTTDSLRSPVEVPDQTAAIIAAVHRRRGYLPRRLLAQVSAVRGAIAAGVLVALGLYAFSERIGLGVQMRGEIEPFSQLTASLPHDASRVLDDLRSWNEQTIGTRASRTLITTPIMEPLELHPRSVRGRYASRDAAGEQAGSEQLSGHTTTVGMYSLSGGKGVFPDATAYSTFSDAYSQSASLAASVDGLNQADSNSGTASITVRPTLRAKVQARTALQDADTYGTGVRQSVTINPASGSVYQMSPGSLEAWSLSTSRRLSNFNTSSSSGVTRQIESAPNSDPLR